MRTLALELADEAVAHGARRARAAAVLGLSVRTLERWRSEECGGTDRRAGPISRPRNALTLAERQRVLEVVTSAQYRDLSPKQIVPALADAGRYIGSESTIYRILRAAGLLAHRNRARPASRRKPATLVARAPGQVWSWDITYLPTTVRGRFLRLYMVMDLFSRKVVAYAIHEQESAELAAALIERAIQSENINRDELTLHSDNGGPMKGATMLAKLEALGVAASFSRPRTSDDNPFSEALFRTMKYRPAYPTRPFDGLPEARRWVAAFVRWYNHVHLHGSIRFVTPADRHAGRDKAILARRANVYAAARRKHPERWATATRNWSRVETVTLNPERPTAACAAKIKPTAA
jgi:transposase InsO family protein